MTELPQVQRSDLLYAAAYRRWAAASHGGKLARLAKRRPLVSGRSAFRLLRASSRLTQGQWLARLAKAAALRAGDRPLTAVELGTCAGVSAMYVLIGMSEAAGGHLTTFEGDPELVDLANYQIRRFLEAHELSNVSFEVKAGRFSETLPGYLEQLEGKVDLAFIDGHHQREPTLEYHRVIRERMAERGIIVHDDIAWTDDMVLAWREISDREDSRIVELMLGDRPSRGLIFLGDPKQAVPERFHFDSRPERWLRSGLRRLGAAT